MIRNPPEKLEWREGRAAVSRTKSPQGCPPSPRETHIVIELNEPIGLWPAVVNETPRPEVLVADLDHSAIADPSLVPRFLVAALLRAGCGVGFDEVYHLIGNPVRSILTELVARHQAVPLMDACRRAVAIEDDFSHRLSDLFNQMPEVRIVPGADNAFAALQADGVRIALDSALPRRVTEALLNRLGWLRSGLVDSVVSADEVEAGRPAGESILLAAARAGATPGARLAKLAATPADIAAAHAAGCRWILGYAGGVFSAESLRAQRPTHVISCLGEVTETLVDRILA